MSLVDDTLHPYGKPYNPSMPNEFKNDCCSYHKISNGTIIGDYPGYWEFQQLGGCSAHKQENTTSLKPIKGYEKF